MWRTKLLWLLFGSLARTMQIILKIESMAKCFNCANLVAAEYHTEDQSVGFFCRINQSSQIVCLTNKSKSCLIWNPVVIWVSLDCQYILDGLVDWNYMRNYWDGLIFCWPGPLLNWTQGTQLQNNLCKAFIQKNNISNRILFQKCKYSIPFFKCFRGPICGSTFVSFPLWFEWIVSLTLWIL